MRFRRMEISKLAATVLSPAVLFTHKKQHKTTAGCTVLAVMLFWIFSLAADIFISYLLYTLVVSPVLWGGLTVMQTPSVEY